SKDDEGTGQSGLQPKLYLLYVAKFEAGAHRIPDRTYANGNARIFSRQSVAEHARYFAADPARRRPSGIYYPRSFSGDAFTGLRDLQRLRTLRKRSGARSRGISRFGKVPVQRAGLGRARQYQRLDHAVEPYPPDQSRASAL